ncbi:MAG: GlsB/YeaQ/YmgE family stress response membrane protein [Methyloceanibacter sp.]|uniref:GlsB/YeaQ/YmgE family stress response membrane protein n=1 Tax=Methyloceanibacter sp. TaxID=1965321 RepID=UPI003D9BE00E
MGRQKDLLTNLLIGVVGTVVGGLLAGLLGLGAYNIIGSIIIATPGAIICLYVWQRMRYVGPLSLGLRPSIWEEPGRGRRGAGNAKKLWRAQWRTTRKRFSPRRG